MNVRRTTTRHDKTLNNLIWQNDVLRNQNILVSHSFRFSFQSLTWRRHMSPTLCLINRNFLFINLFAALFVFYLFCRWYHSITLYLSTAMSSDRMKGTFKHKLDAPLVKYAFLRKCRGSIMGLTNIGNYSCKMKLIIFFWYSVRDTYITWRRWASKIL